MPGQGRYRDEDPDPKNWTNAKLLNYLIDRISTEHINASTEEVIDAFERRVIRNPNSRGQYKA